MKYVGAMPWHFRLRDLPVGCFSIVLGYAGLSISSQKAEVAFGLGHTGSQLLDTCTYLIFMSFIGLYVAKAVLYGRAVYAELEDPINVHFFPTISMSLMLLSVMIFPVHVAIAKILFLIGAPLQFILTILVLHFWLNREHFEMNHVNPAWFIPAVGNAIAPISGVGLGFTETSWFFFSIGIVFWIVLLPIVINRMLFGLALSDQLAPTLFILLAPPAVNFISYVTLTGTVDAAARVLYYFALFIAVFLITQVPRLARLQFSLTWWAYSFPVAAVTTASWLIYEKTHIAPLLNVAIGLQMLLIIIIAFLSARTVIALLRSWSWSEPSNPSLRAHVAGTISTQASDPP